MKTDSILVNAHTHNLSDHHVAIYQLDIDHAIPSNTLFSIGVHPQSSLKLPQLNIQRILETLKNKHCVAIGETGLDTRYNVALEIQEACFISQLQLAAEWNKPVILHCVNQWDRCRFLYEKYAPKVPLIYHGFNKASILETVLKTENVYISIGAGVLTNHSLQQKLSLIPLNRLLVETDTADVHLLEIYTCIAENLSVSLQTLIEQIYSNAKIVFKL